MHTQAHVPVCAGTTRASVTESQPLRNLRLAIMFRPVAVAKSQSEETERLLNRELSWLEFNARVLELAADPDEPLLERVRFCSIFSSNLDEFFMVRVAGLLDQVDSGLLVRSPDGLSAQETLVRLRSRVLELTAQQATLWKRELKPALAEQGIVVAGVDECTETELLELAGRFEHEIYPVLTPLGVGPGQPFPYISGLSLSLGIAVRDPETNEERFARVKVPEGLPRFVPVGMRGLLVPLEAVIGHFLSRLFTGMEFSEQAIFRVTRDADFSVSDEADDLLEAVKSEVRRRRFGDVVRLEVSSSISKGMLARLEERLGVSGDQVYPVRGLFDLADLVEIAAANRPDLKYEPWMPYSQPRIASPTDDDLLAEIGRGDLLVQHPYDSFASSVERFVRSAAKDSHVVAMKTTVYRTNNDSALAPALIEAAEQGKQSVCLVELKARFDERRNIEWSRRLEQAGVHVVYGFPHLKIHAKTTLILRRESDGLRRYVHIGTGNYHALTARVYEDVGLFTADADIAADVADLFNFVTGFGRPQRFRKLLVAPINLRAKLVEHIRRVGEAAASGKTGRIRLKVNALTDAGIVQELYAAAGKGAEIDVVSRSVCTLRPGVEGLSERIRVRSILGRFLEHSRLFHFEAGDEVTSLLGSADLMPRNLDHRIEVLVPIESQRLRDELAGMFEALLADNVQAWELQADGTWQRQRPAKGERRKAAQTVFMRRRERARRLQAPTNSR
jgi:polyphosphate kinase